MSLNTVKNALTVIIRDIGSNSSSYETSTRRKLLDTANSMHYFLVQEDIGGFIDYIDTMSGCEPDSTDLLLEYLFEATNCKTLEDLEVKLAE